MSLQIAAKHLAAKGRGPDTTLVHMTNKEVQGLQALAEKNGGSLSINPDTGLPEAGFLESILPVVAGVGLTAAGMGPMAAALTVGGVSALSTGSLSKGLFAGLGAYGGASLGGQLATQGMTEAAAANASFGDKLANMGQNASFENIGNFISANPKTAMAGLAGPLLSSMEDDSQNDKPSEPVEDADRGARAKSGIKFNPGYMTPTPLPNPYGIEQTYARPYYGAEGGVAHMAEGGSTSEPIDTRTQFADYLKKVMNPTNRTNAVSGSTNPYEWWKSTGTPEAKPAAPAAPVETYEEYAARMQANARGNDRGSGQTAEEREAQLNEVNDYLSTPENPVTMNQYFAMDKEARNKLDAAAAERNPIRGAIKTGVETLSVPMAYRVFESLRNKFTGPDTNDPKSVGMVLPTENDRIKAEETAKYRQSLLGDTSGYEQTPTTAGIGVPAGGPIDYGPESGYMTNTDPYFSTQLGPGVGTSTLSLPTSQDAVAQTNAALGYTFQPDAVRDMLANSALPESNKIVDKYLADNANIATTPAAYTFQPNAIQDALNNSKVDLFGYPGRFNDLADRYLFANEINRVTTEDAKNAAVQRAADEAANLANMKAYTPAAYTFQPNAIQNLLDTSALPSESNKIVDKYLADNTAAIAPTAQARQAAMTASQKDRIEQMLGVDPYAKFDQFDFGPNALAAKAEQDAATEAQKARIRALTEAPESQFLAQDLMSRDIDTFAPVSYSAADEADRMFAAPDIVGINEIKAEADPNADNYAQILKAFDRDNADVAGLLSKPGVQLAAGAGYTGGISDGSALAGVPASTGYYSNNQGGRGLGISGLGGVWRSADGTPIRTGDGSSLQTGEGARQESSNDRVERIVQEARQSNPDPNPGRDIVGRDGFSNSMTTWGGEGGSEAADGGLSTPYGFQHMAQGGISDPYNLGSYSDGGRLLKGPGDGVSDSIPATIGKGRPARLADGEFVIPARIVSEIGNGSTEAGARKLYAMMDRIQASRRNTVGKGKVAVNNRADKYLPA